MKVSIVWVILRSHLPLPHSTHTVWEESLPWPCLLLGHFSLFCCDLWAWSSQPIPAHPYWGLCLGLQCTLTWSSHAWWSRSELYLLALRPWGRPFDPSAQVSISFFLWKMGRMTNGISFSWCPWKNALEHTCRATEKCLILIHQPANVSY